MPGQSDDTLKQLTERSPADWVVQGGWPPATAAIVDADIATISGASDKVIRVAGRHGKPDWLLAVDFQSGHDSASKLPDLLLYNSALYRRHNLLVRSLMVLLHKGADSPQLTGFYERGFPGEAPDVTLSYRVVRVWKEPPEKWLSGGLGLVPLAPLGDVREEQLPTVIAKMKRRFDRDAFPRDAAELWSATLILMGLRYEQALVEKLIQGVQAMEESVTYQAILKKGEAQGEARGEARGKALGKALGEARGKAEEARKILVMLGSDKLGEPSRDVQAALNGMTVAHQLEELFPRLKRVVSWEELLGLGVPQRKAKKRKPSS